MKLGLLLIWVTFLPALAHSEIYKWIDKNGTVRYSDTPPPSNIKIEPIGKKIPKPTAPSPAVSHEESTGVVVTSAPNDVASKDEAAAKRAKNAEEQKKVEASKREELKIKQENCAVAKRNLATYNNGGRISTTDERGERTYLGDDDIAKGRADSQRDVEKYCN
jgi:hypothetical protein